MTVVLCRVFVRESKMADMAQKGHEGLVQEWRKNFLFQVSVIRA